MSGWCSFGEPSFLVLCYKLGNSSITVQQVSKELGSTNLRPSLCVTDLGRSRLLASKTKESGAWLNAFPASSLGTLLDNQSFRIAISLRLGTPLCHPHQCICGSTVDEFGMHGLSCKRSAGRKSRQDMVNDLLKRALAICGISAIKEPNGCNRADGKKPDGLTLIPWERGKPLIWDFTCADTVCQSYLPMTKK